MESRAVTPDPNGTLKYGRPPADVWWKLACEPLPDVGEATTMDAETQRFAEEIKTFEAHRGQWVRDGKTCHWVAVLKDRFLGPSRSLDELWDLAIQTFKRGFMIKRIFEKDRPVIVSNFEMTKEEDAA